MVSVQIFAHQYINCSSLWHDKDLDALLHLLGFIMSHIPANKKWKQNFKNRNIYGFTYPIRELLSLNEVSSGAKWCKTKKTFS